MRFGPLGLRVIERSHYHESTQKIYGGNGIRRGEVSKFLMNRLSQPFTTSYCFLEKVT